MRNYPLYKVDSYTTFYDYISKIAKFGDNPAIAYYDKDHIEHTRSYAQLKEDVNCLRKKLLDMGMFGTHIAVAGENSYEWLVAFLGITSAGAVAVCVDIEQPDKVVMQLIKQVDTKVVFASPTFLPICATLLEDYSIAHLFSINSEAGTASSNSLGRLIEEGKQLNEPGKDVGTPELTAAIVFTSGTTSKSKPVMLTHKNILQNVTESAQYVDLYKKVFTALPFYHSYGLTSSLLGPMSIGVKLTINGDIKTMVKDLISASPDAAMTVPLMVEALYNGMWTAFAKHGKDKQVKKVVDIYMAFKKIGIKLKINALVKAKEACFGDLRLMVCGGAHIGAEICEKLEAFGVLVLQGYGITECSPLISVNRNGYCKFGSVGRVLPSSEVKLVDEEIWVRGPNVMKGYYNDPAATAEVFEDEWFKTGDLGNFDKDGFLYISGRIKTLIVLKNGKKISPEKIEELIHEIPMVKDVVVYGAASGSTADDVKPAASIYPDPNLSQGMTDYEILEHLQSEINKINNKLPGYQQVQMVNVRDREFLKTASKKIKRHMI